jgi:hypothetical protein
MDIVIVDIKIKTTIKGKSSFIELNDFLTTNPISEYGKAKILRKTGGLPYEIVKFDVKKIIGQTSSI